MILLKKITRKIKRKIKPSQTPNAPETPFLEKAIISVGIPAVLGYNQDRLRFQTLNFIENMNCGGFEYRYAPSVGKPNIYNGIYVAMILDLYNNLPDKDICFSWAAHINSFQDPSTGFFIDNRINNQLFNTIDWWGCRHLVCHATSALASLGARSAYPLKFTTEWYDTNRLKQWLDSVPWDTPIPDSNDIDNQIMNIGTALQYQRDFWNDKSAGIAIQYIKHYLRTRTNTTTGLWGNYDVTDSYQLPRMIQFSYHLLRLFFYDNEPIENQHCVIDLILSSQNTYGGFGERLNSSACEDIDAIDILIYCASQDTTYRHSDIEIALRRSLIFILSQQNADGGFVFRRDEPFWYGHDLMSSGYNESAMFPTWFRTLCVAKICNYLGISNYPITHVPGY